MKPIEPTEEQLRMMNRDQDPVDLMCNNDPLQENDDQDQELTKRDKLDLLYRWSMRKGVLGLENVELRAEFRDDVCETDKDFEYEGIRALSDIPHRKAFLAVPFELIISPNKFKEEEPELYEYLIQQAPDLFDTKECDDAEQLLMTFYLMHEWTKGKESKWYPYLNNFPENQ